MKNAQTLNQVKEEGKNLRNEPHHMQGEWSVIISRHKIFKYTGSEDDFTWNNWSDYLAISDEELCSMGSEVSLGNIEIVTICHNISEANAQLIAKAVNEYEALKKKEAVHDELIETVKKLEMGLNNLASERTSTWNKYESIISKANQLLKQAQTL